MHTDLRTLKDKECEAQYSSQIDSKCCRPAEDKLTIQRSSAYNKWFIRLPPREPLFVDLLKISLKPSIYTLKSCGDKPLVMMSYCDLHLLIFSQYFV